MKVETIRAWIAGMRATAANGHAAEAREMQDGIRRHVLDAITRCNSLPQAKALARAALEIEKKP